MYLIVHRGGKEIGGSCVELRSKVGAILIDIGLPLDFVDKSLTAEEYRKKGLFPDIPGIYLDDPLSPSIDAILISHGHLDHYGILPFIKEDIPVCIGFLTWEIIQVSAPFLQKNAMDRVPSIFLQDQRSFHIGGFTVTPFLIDHSAFDAYSFLVSDGEKTVLYSGDFRSHGRKASLLDRLLKKNFKGIDALVLEGTNISRDGCESVKSEIEVERRIITICRETDNLVMAYCSSQNIDRIVSLYKAAMSTNRLLVIDIYTAHILLAASKAGNIIPVPGRFKAMKVYFPHRLASQVAEHGSPELLYRFRPSKITRQEISKKRNNILILVRPSVRRELELISGLDGATLIYSLWEGYMKEKSVSTFLKWLEGQGTTIEQVHASGHADRETLERVINTLQPKALLPIHTLEPEKYRELTSATLLSKDGQSVII